MFDYFGRNNPARMPRHFFSGALKVDFSTAIRADIHRQNFSTVARCWYVDARFTCARCGQMFLFSAAEQQFWYEQLRFYVDSLPRDCRQCRHDKRDLLMLQQEYARNAAGVVSRQVSAVSKQRMMAVIDQIEAAGGPLPLRMVELRHTLQTQLQRNPPA